jgi:hypothetical protein
VFPLFFTLALLSKTTIIPFGIIIPLTLVFFTEARAGKIALTSLLLALPAYFLLNINSGFDRFLIIILMTLTWLFFYALKNWNAILAWAKRVPSVNTNVFKITRKSTPLETSTALHKITLAELLPDRAILNPAVMVLLLLLGASYVVAIFSQASILSLIPLAGVLVLTFSAKQDIEWWAQTVLAFCVAAAVIFFSQHDLSFFQTSYAFLLSRLVAVYLAYTLIYGDRNLFLPRLLAFAAVIAFSGPHIIENLLTLLLMILISYSSMKVCARI